LSPIISRTGAFLRLNDERAIKKPTNEHIRLEHISFNKKHTNPQNKNTFAYHPIIPEKIPPQPTSKNS
jgi:hypothetical protein